MTTAAKTQLTPAALELVDGITLDLSKLQSVAQMLSALSGRLDGAGREADPIWGGLVYVFEDMSQKIDSINRRVYELLHCAYGTP